MYPTVCLQRTRGTSYQDERHVLDFTHREVSVATSLGSENPGLPRAQPRGRDSWTSDAWGAERGTASSHSKLCGV